MRRASSLSRAVGYLFAAPLDSDLEFDEAKAEAILDKALERGTISQYDTGRGRTCWFNGPPGADLRKVRDEIARLMPAGMERRR